jgi:hypothetical protein
MKKIELEDLGGGLWLILFKGFDKIFFIYKSLCNLFSGKI